MQIFRTKCIFGRLFVLEGTEMFQNFIPVFIKSFILNVNKVSNFLTEDKQSGTSPIHCVLETQSIAGIVNIENQNFQAGILSALILYFLYGGS